MLNTVAKLAYRPLRVAWVIDDNSLEQLQEAFRWNCCIWGGERNFIFERSQLPSPEELAKRYSVDVLSDVREPREHGTKTTTILDFRHYQSLITISHLGKREVRLLEMIHFLDFLKSSQRMESKEWLRQLTKFEFDIRDPFFSLGLLRGGYPSPKTTVVDYENVLCSALAVQHCQIPDCAQLPASFWTTSSFSSLTNVALSPRDYYEGLSDLVFFIGNVRSVSDLRSYWNLRASGLSVIFIEQNSFDRCENAIKGLADSLRKKFPSGLVSGKCSFSIGGEIADETYRSVLERLLDIFRAQKVQLELAREVPRSASRNVTFSTTPREVLGVPNKRDRTHVFSFSLTDKPFDGARCRSSGYFAVDLEYRNYEEFECFSTPFIPELTEFCGRNQIYPSGYDRARLKSFGLSIISRAMDEVVSLRSYDSDRLFEAFFGACGLRTNFSKSSHVVLQLIRRLGGLEGFRPLKVEGVRKLIAKLKLDEGIPRSQACLIISGRHQDPELKCRELESSYHFGIDGERPNAESLFTWLVSMELLMPGLSIECQHCHLDGWISLDNVRATVCCEFCGLSYPLGPQLRHRGDWKFRKSGLLGRDDNQGGGIPVGLALQCFNLNLQGRLGALPYTVCVSLKGDDLDCEVDFCCLYSDRDGIPALIIGEAKSQGGCIDANDLNNLKNVARRVQERLAMKVFICVAKTGRYTAEELKVLKATKAAFDRLIILSEVELERIHSYLDYQNAPSRVELVSAHDPQGFVRNSELLYLVDPEANN